MRGFLKRHLLWAGLAGVVAPLAVLLVMQYRWLADLEEKSAIAHEATLHNLLEGITTEAEYFYRKNAERALNLPPSLFTLNRLDQAAYHFRKKEVIGARRLFVVSFYKEDWGKVLFYEPSIPSMEPPTSLADSQAAYVASAPWMVLSQKNATIDTIQLSVDERDPERRIILNPIVDESSRLVGMSGMMLDDRFFRAKLLPKIIESATQEFFRGGAARHVAVHVHGGGDGFQPGREEPLDHEDEAVNAMSFVFTDHRLGIASRGVNPKEWARASFLLNITVAGLVGLALLGGVVVALRAASREMRLSQMKNDFVSNVSHELRTPLASIRVFGEFLRLGRVSEPEKVREYGEFIETESRRLTGLVNNILDFSRIESGRKIYRFDDADLAGVVAETVRMFDVRLKHSGFVITIREDGPLPPVRIDADSISQAIGNLLDNAVKYSGDSREIGVVLSRADGWAVISVEDKGIGISRDQQEKIFDRFHRVGTGLVHDVRGSGLGLSIVRHIAEAHRGRVTVKSRPGDGSVFSIRLPIHAEDTDAQGADR